MMKANLILVATLLALTACTPNSAGGVRELDATKKTNFTAYENYQAVYRKILEMSRKCSEGGMLTAQMVIKNDLYTDIKTGSISLELHGALGIDVYHVTDIKYLTEAKSDVTVHFVMANQIKHANTIKKWALENYKECS